MGNTGKKIIILGLFIAMAVAGVLVFYPTIVAPPTDVPVNNLHTKSLQTSISAFSEVRGVAYNDSVYAAIADKLALYKKESFISDKEADNQTDAFVQAYVPIFAEQSNAKFKASVWYEKDHKDMLKRIGQLRELKVDGGKSSPLTDLHRDALKGLETIIDNYRKAKKVASYSSFNSVSDAKNKIKEADEYKKMEPLLNCKSLVEKLSDVRANIGRSHYRKVETKVNKTDNYRDISEQDFDTLMRAANKKIKEYDSTRYMYGSNAKTTDDLISILKENRNSAKEYYNRKEIRITKNNQWTTMSSPSDSYRGYQSFYNKGRANVNAMMSFTIKGYESFSFYVRSNGEASYDYLMVGLDSIPAVNSNNFSTKDKAQSGDKLYNYQGVSFKNLEKTRSYTIYIVYRKDGSKDEGDDRGYLLIPNENIVYEN